MGMDSDYGKPQAEDEGDDYLKPVPEGYLPPVENESSAFRSLDLSESEEEDDDEGFLKKKAVQLTKEFVVEVENESHAFRSFGLTSEEDEKEEEKAEEKKEGKGFQEAPMSSWIASTTSSEFDRSSGTTPIVACECCECCPYHDAAEKEKEKSEKKSQRPGKKSQRSSKKSGPSKKSSENDRRRAKSIDAAEGTTTARNRPSQIMSRVFASLLPLDNDEDRLVMVCSAFADAMLQSGALANGKDDSDETEESEE